MKLIKKLVFKNLILNKKRTLVTIVGIVLSVALLAALTTMVSSFQRSLVEYQKGKSGDYHVMFTHVDRDDISTLAENRSIESFYVMSEVGYATLAESKNSGKPYAHVVAMSETAMERTRFTLLEGRFPKTDNEVVIPRHLKTNGRVEYKVGDVLKLAMGQRVDTQSGRKMDASENFSEDYETLIDTEEKEYTVVGVIERPGYGVEPYVAPGYTFVTYGNQLTDNMTVFARFTKQGLKNSAKLTGAILGVDPEQFERVYAEHEYVDEEEFNQVMEQLNNAKFGMDMNFWLIQYERVWPINSAFIVIFILALIVACIIIVTSVYCIKNSFEISISEKIRQYGMLASIGATKRQIRKSVYREATLMAYIGIPLGCAGGLLASFILVRLSEYLLWDSLHVHLVFHPSLIAIAVAVLLGIVTIYLSALRSAVKAGKVSPMEAIRNQKEIALKSKRLRTPKYVKQLFGIGGVISYKSIKRNRRKYRTTVVSIVICTMTFIVVTYFMSMAFELVGMTYVNSEYNLSMGLSLYDGGELKEQEIRNLENIQELSIQRRSFMTVENPVYSSQMEEYLKKIGNDDWIDGEIQIVSMDDASFEKYAGECGMLLVDNEKAILVNNYKMDADKDRGIQDGYVTVYNLSKGDHMQLVCYDSWISEYDLEQTTDKIYHYDFTLGAVTDVRPVGSKGSTWAQFLVISNSLMEKLQMEEALGYDFNLFFESDNPDQLQDDLEQIILPKYDGNTGYSMFNRDKNQKNETSLYLLLDIFAYGLIVVIGLIGITNIINTLGTSVELRSREFATLRSVGMTNRQFDKMIVLESLFTAGKSLVIGVSLGMLICVLIHRVECQMDTVIPFKPPVMATIIVVVTVFVLIYCIIRTSLHGIVKRNVIETIKNENV